MRKGFNDDANDENHLVISVSASNFVPQPQSPGGNSHIKVTGMLFVSLKGGKLQISILLGGFGTEGHLICPFRCRLGLGIYKEIDVTLTVQKSANA